MSKPTYEELHALSSRLQQQATKHLHTQQELINAKNQLDREVELFRAIHAYVQEALQVDELAPFAELTLESIIGAFEFEVSLFLEVSDDASRLRLLNCFGVDDPPESLPWNDTWRPRSAKVFGENHEMLKAWSELDLAALVVCPWRDRDGHFRGLIAGGVTRHSADIYPAPTPDIESSFALLAEQAGSLWVRKELDAELAGLTRSYSRFVPFEFLELLGRGSIQEITIGDHVALDMTVLFSDLRGFTPLSEELTTAEVFGVLNEYLSVMEPEIRAEGGFINQFQGDAIMALFHERPDAAVRCGVAMQGALTQLNVRRRERNDAELFSGVGLHSGELMLGAIGGARRMDSNVVGDTANLASRIEGCTKIYGARLLITGVTHTKLEQPDAFCLRELDRVVVKGRKEPVTLYEVLDADPSDLHEAKQRYQDRFTQGLTRYREGAFRDARLDFMACVLERPDDGPANLYVDRCGDLARNPPYYWDGITVLDSK